MPLNEGKKLSLTINGVAYALSIIPGETLAELLRQRLHLTGTKIGCNEAECGACTVLMNDEPVFSCSYPAVRAQGKEIITIEGLAKDGQLDVVQQTIIEKGGVQCGFCTPGMLISATALLKRNAHPTDVEIREAIVGNLCRCTGYVRIVDAIKQSAK